MPLGPAFIECPHCKSSGLSITRIGGRQFECLVCAELFELDPPKDERPVFVPGKRKRGHV